MPLSSTTDPALQGAVAGGLLVLCTKYTADNGVTVAHEAGHAVTALLFGSGLKSIQIDTRAQGVTAMKTPTFWPARVIVFMAGYASPPLVGLAVLWAILRGHIQVAFLVGLVLLLLSVPFWKGWWTLLCGVLHVAVFTAGLVTSAEWSRALAGGVAAVGLLGGLDMLVEDVRGDWKRGDSSDFGQVAKALFLPMVVSKAMFLAVALATEGVALWLLLGDRAAGTGP